MIRLAWSLPDWRPWACIRSDRRLLVRTTPTGVWMGKGGVVVVGWLMLWWLVPEVFVPMEAN